jgi:hypothetical protein
MLPSIPAGFASFGTMAESISAQVTAEKYCANLPCAPKDAKAPDDSCVGQILSRYGSLLFRRPALQRGLAAAIAEFYFPRGNRHSRP